MLAAALCLASQPEPVPTSPWEREIIYQIFPRSFRDSDGDRVGDLRGIASKLDYVKGLGATAILLNPVFASPMYHSYFATDFRRVDPAYGTNQDFFDLVRAAHRKDLKVILDVEVQYVAQGHPWYTAAAKNPSGPEAAYFWDDKWFFTSVPLPSFDGSTVSIKALDPSNLSVRREVEDALRYWVSPNGKAIEGVDGFRIDHMMDDFDFQGVQKEMLASFWRPIEQGLRKTRPGLFFLGEQADAGLAKDLFAKGDVDAAYAYPLWWAIGTRDVGKLAQTVALESEATPVGKTQVVFLENHDVVRVASAVNSDPRLLRTGAVLNLTLKGTPYIYYGQELGMRGKKGDWNSDGNDIPLRLAFRWNRSLEAAGTATWYGGTGPWGNDRYSKSGDGISVEEENGDPDSLLNFYRKLAKLRQGSLPLREGSQEVLTGMPPSVFAFIRSKGQERVIVAVNFSSESVSVELGDTLRHDLLTNEGLAGHRLMIPQRGFRVARLASR